MSNNFYCPPTDCETTTVSVTIPVPPHGYGPVKWGQVDPRRDAAFWQPESETWRLGWTSIYWFGFHAYKIEDN